MTFRILNRQVLSNNIKRLDIEAPLIVRQVWLGQFVILSIKPHDDKISLPIIDADSQRKSITLIFQETDAALIRLGQLQINDEIYLVAGPFGNGVTIEKWGSVACIADGIGIAQILSVARALKQVGNKVMNFIGASTRASLILQSQMRLISYKIFMATEDGSFEKRGRILDAFREFLNKDKVDRVFTAGSAELMEGVCALTRPKNIKTWVCLNPVMLDGTGICGSCRVTVDGKIRLACVDGPIFDGHSVNFEDYKIRLNATKEFAWDNLKSFVSPKRSESKIFEKFLLGILKK